jgi:hypothetical protein
VFAVQVSLPMPVYWAMELATSPVDEDEGSVESCVLSFRPEADRVSRVRHFVEDFYTRALNDDDLGSRVGLALHELLENAVKYGRRGQTQVRVDICPSVERTRIRISIRNQARPEDIASLRMMVEEMNAASDPFIYYQQAMRRSAKRVNGSGLGLARIRAEADMQMSFEQSAGDEVTVCAETDAPPPGVT